MHKIGIITTALFSALFTGCTFEADGTIRPGWDSGYDESHIVESSGYSKYGDPMILDTYAECWLIKDDPNYAGYYAWFFQADVDHTGGYISDIESVWIDIYDSYGLARTVELYDNVTYRPWLQPEWVGAEGLWTDHNDGIFMHSQFEVDPLRCGSAMGYEVYTTVYDVYGSYVTSVEYL